MSDETNQTEALDDATSLANIFREIEIIAAESSARMHDLALEARELVQKRMDALSGTLSTSPEKKRFGRLKVMAATCDAILEETQSREPEEDIS